MKKNFVPTALAAAVFSTAMIGAPLAAHADSETLGTLGGAAAGGLIGSQFGKGSGNVAATVGGVIAGGVIGNAIGRDADESRYRSTTYYDNGYDNRYYAPPPRTVVVERAYAPPPPVVVYDDPYYYPHRHYRYYRGYYRGW